MVGGRYEFHPTSAESPYRDNACTATKQLAGPTLPPSQPARQLLPGWLPIDEPAGPLGYVIFLGFGAVGIVLLLAAARRVLGKRTEAPR